MASANGVKMAYPPASKIEGVEMKEKRRKARSGWRRRNGGSWREMASAVSAYGNREKPSAKALGVSAHR
jgi:hypothetical protein